MRDVRWPSGASAHNNPDWRDSQELARQYGCPLDYHPVVRDGVLLGYAPDDDECNYDIDDIIPA